MNDKSRREDDSLPYIVWKAPNGTIHYKNKIQKKFLTREEAFQAAQLEQLVERHSTFVREYYLVRSSLSDSMPEKRAWQILYLLLQFVEAEGRFPNLRKGNSGLSELTDYLDSQLKIQPVLANLPLKEIDKVSRLLGLNPKRPIFRQLDNFQLSELGNQLRISLRRYVNEIIPLVQSSLKEDMTQDKTSSHPTE